MTDGESYQHQKDCRRFFVDGRAAGYEMALQKAGEFLEERGYAMLAEDLCSHLHNGRPEPAYHDSGWTSQHLVGAVALLIAVLLGAWLF